MEINKLFGGGAEQEQPRQEKKSDHLQFTVSHACACTDLVVQPLIYGLQKGLVKHDFKLELADGKTCTQRLVQGDAQIGLIPSIEYAKGKGAWKIIPDICIAHPHEIGSMALFFNKDLHTLRHVAVDERYPTAIALLQIVLREKYEIEPKLIPMPSDLNKMLLNADAALLSGDLALKAQAEFPAHLDLGDEWYDLTEMPFVSAIWAGHELSLTENEATILKQSAEIGRQNIEKISKEFASRQKQDFGFYKNYLEKQTRYTLGVAEKESLTEFFSYAFYLGIIEHIPELHFLGEEENEKAK